MARSPNCTGAPLFKGRVDVSISYPDPDETPLETPVDLPTSEPAEAQISYTLASGHMPMWSPCELEHVKTANILASGQNASGANRAVYYRILKNGSSVATGSYTVYTGRRYTWQYSLFFGVSEGDTLSCALWANGTGCDLDYHVLFITPTRIGPYNVLVLNFIIPVLARMPNLRRVPGGSYSRAEGDVYIYHDDIAVNSYKTATSQRLLLSGGIYRLIRTYAGDISNVGTCKADGTTVAFIANYVPYRIAYTPLNLRV